jgi:hypothetical protein
MRNLTIGDLDLGLRDLHDKRKSAALDASMAGKIHGPQLAAARAAIEALPDALDGSRPKTAQLGSITPRPCSALPIRATPRAHPRSVFATHSSRPAARSRTLMPKRPPPRRRTGPGSRRSRRI